jgi:probable HAF family extracellular repeat protein
MRIVTGLAAIGVACVAVFAQTVTIQDLGSLGGSSVGLAVNNRGEVAGYSNRIGSTDKHAFIKPTGLVMGDLNFYTTYTNATSYGYAINQKGAVAGSIDPETHHLPIAFLWDGSPTLTMLGTLGGGMSEALGINASGKVTGWAVETYGGSHAFTGSAKGLTDLGVLPGGNASSGTAMPVKSPAGATRPLEAGREHFCTVPAGR